MKMAKELNNFAPNDAMVQAKKNFIAIVSHQLRTPIAAVRWSLETLLGGKFGALKPQQVQVIKEAYQNNQHLVKLVNDLLRATLIEEQGIKLVPRMSRMDNLVRAVVAQNRDYISATNSQIKLRIKSARPTAYIDQKQISRVIDGLIHNAISYSRHQPRITIAVTQNKQWCRVEVTDHGIGIPREQQQLLFSNFFRGRNASKQQVSGLGLDLFIAQKIITASNGHITFVSVENRGTTFQLDLPVDSVDLSDKRQLQSATVAAAPDSKQEQEFVFVTVHELRAPLNTSKWSLEMLKTGTPGPLTTEQRKLLDQIEFSTARMLTLVGDLLNLSKLQAGQFLIVPRKILLEPLIKKVIEQFTPQALAKSIAIRNLKSPDGAAVYADAERLIQVFVNLISNAIKYTPQSGQVTISITKKSGIELRRINRRFKRPLIAYTDHGKGYRVISISDTGIGISAADQTKLFAKFFRSRQVMKTKSEGTGLGLYIAKSIVNLHKGDIWFESSPGHGSTFYVSLPIA